MKTHYVAGPELLARNLAAASKVSIHATNDNMDALAKDELPLGVSYTELPVPLRIAVRTTHLKSRMKPEEMRRIITRLCDWKPLSVAEIAAYLDKQPSYLSQKYIVPMVSEGILRYLYPEMPQHPGQKYQTVRLSERD